MPLFRDHPIRSAVGVAVALSVGHFITKLMNSLHAFHLTQTSVAILAIASLMFLVTMHHKRDGHLLTQGQEEILLIGGFGLFWVAVLLAWRAITHRSVEMGIGKVIDQPAVARTVGYSGSAVRPYPCSSDDIYCVVEEWRFF